MLLGTRKLTDSGVVPLQTAVLCLDCECVTSGRFDECAVCGGHSLLSIARMLGGTLESRKINCPQRDEGVVRFDVSIQIDLKEMESNELNKAIEGVTGLIATNLGQGRAFCHINVEPVVSGIAADQRNAEAAKAA